MYNSDQNQTSDNTDRPSATPLCFTLSPFAVSRFNVFNPSRLFRGSHAGFSGPFRHSNHNEIFGTKMKNLKTRPFRISSLEAAFWHDRPIFQNVLGRSPTRYDTPRHGSRGQHTRTNTVEQRRTPGAMPPVKRFNRQRSRTPNPTTSDPKIFVFLRSASLRWPCCPPTRNCVGVPQLSTPSRTGTECAWVLL